MSDVKFNWQNCRQEDMDKPMKGKSQEKLLISAQSNTIRTNYVQAKIDNTQQNSKCWLCGERNESINNIVSECNKLAQEYKTRFNWVGNVILKELYKRFNFDHTTKWYVHKPESIQENDMHKNLWDFEKQIGCLILIRPCAN